jgi:hypothetical protein
MGCNNKQEVIGSVSPPRSNLSPSTRQDGNGAKGQKRRLIRFEGGENEATKMVKAAKLFAELEALFSAPEDATTLATITHAKENMERYQKGVESESSIREQEGWWQRGHSSQKAIEELWDEESFYDRLQAAKVGGV